MLLPERFYEREDPEVRTWTERHLAQALKGEFGQRYVQRMKSCCPSRPCNLLACPICEASRTTRYAHLVVAQLQDRPREAIASLDALMPPRAKLDTFARTPIDDTRWLRRIMRSTFPRHRCSLFLLGRYEVTAKRMGETPYLLEFDLPSISRVVIPHFHLILCGIEHGRYLDRSEVRSRLQLHFPVSGQLRVRGLDASQPTPEAITKRVGYIFKNKTSDLEGRLLHDFVKSQLTRRSDAWVLKYQTGLFLRTLDTVSSTIPSGISQGRNEPDITWDHRRSHRNPP